MAKEVILPKFGFTLEESQIVEWLVREGDTVAEGDPLVEVTTDKVNMEVEAPTGGIVAGIRAQAGEMVPVTAVIAYILQPGELLPTPNLQSPISQSPISPSSPSATPVAARMAAANQVDLAQVAGTGSGGKVTRQDVEAFLARQPEDNGKLRATPAARRVAREQGVDLTAVSGTGPHHRIQQQDVLTYVEAQHISAPPPSRSPAPLLPTSPAAHRIPFTPMRRTIARNLQRSMQEAPHITFQADMDMTALVALLARVNKRVVAAGEKEVTITAVLTKAVAWTLKQNPMLNAHLGDDEIWLHDDVHIGIAVALDDGLIVPVVRDVTSKGVGQLNREIREVAGRARSGKLRPDDLGGATFTISNLGMLGIDRFTAIINPPEVGILAVGGTRRLLVPDENDQPVVKPICTMTLSVDHRVVDGAVAARFMADLREVVGFPELMMV